jgi:hypothetical protein
MFLAVFLSFLAGCGLFCFALVLSMLFDTETYLFIWVLIFCPLAGFFYWKGAGRIEKIVFRLDNNNSSTDTLITIQAHRDELIQLQSNFPFNYSVKEG